MVCPPFLNHTDMSMSSMVAKRLLKKWLQNSPPEEGELRTALMMYEEKGDVHLVQVGLRLNEGGLVEVSRVIQKINIDEAV